MFSLALTQYNIKRYCVIVYIISIISMTTIIYGIIPMIQASDHRHYVSLFT